MSDIYIAGIARIPAFSIESACAQGCSGFNVAVQSLDAETTDAALAIHLSTKQASEVGAQGAESARTGIGRGRPVEMGQFRQGCRPIPDGAGRSPGQECAGFDNEYVHHTVEES